MSNESLNIENIDQDTVLLVDVFKNLNLHYVVGCKMFVAHPPIDKSVYNVDQIYYHGKNIKIYRMGGNSNIHTWRVSLEMAELIKKTFYKLGRSGREFAINLSKKIYDVELQTKSDQDMCKERFLLQMYENQQIKIVAKISKLSHINTFRNGSIADRLRVCFVNLINPETEAIYADHTNVLLNNDLESTFLHYKIGTILEFKATVRSYYHQNEIKYGIHDLQSIKVLQSYDVNNYKIE